MHRAHCWQSMDWSRNTVNLRSDDGLISNWPECKESMSWSPSWLEDSNHVREWHFQAQKDTMGHVRHKKKGRIEMHPTIQFSAQQ